MAKKRKLVYNGHHGEAGEEARCLWCGEPTTAYEYVVNPGGTPLLKCCCEEHYRQATDLVEKDARYRSVFFVVIAALALVSWAAIGFIKPEPVWAPLPLVGIALVLVVWPRVLPRYEYYLPFGIVKTRRVVRVVATALLIFSLYYTGVTFGVLPG